MTLQDVRKIPTFQTRALAEDAKDSPETLAYLVNCLNRMYAGDYGEIDAEDTAANNTELADGEGRILARYKKAHALKDDIYINCYFSESNPDNLDFNNCMFLYCSEY